MSTMMGMRVANSFEHARSLKDARRMFRAFMDALPFDVSISETLMYLIEINRDNSATFQLTSESNSIEVTAFNDIKPVYAQGPMRWVVEVRNHKMVETPPGHIIRTDLINRTHRLDSADLQYAPIWASSASKRSPDANLIAHWWRVVEDYHEWCTQSRSKGRGWIIQDDYSLADQYHPSYPVLVDTKEPVEKPDKAVQEVKTKPPTTHKRLGLRSMRRGL